jgi:hypothetical protein
MCKTLKSQSLVIGLLFQFLTDEKVTAVSGEDGELDAVSVLL